MNTRAARVDQSMRFTSRPATAETWDHLQQLLGPRGGWGGCWCTYWRLRSKEFATTQGEDRRWRLEEQVRSELSPGVLLYANKHAIGWAAFAPAAQYPRVLNS
jgi:hypothetical protein